MNGKKRISQRGREPCYDIIMEELGTGAIYAYAFLPSSVTAGLLQGLKRSESSIEQLFQKKSKTISIQPTTKYMFIHWEG